MCAVRQPTNWRIPPRGKRERGRSLRTGGGGDWEKDDRSVAYVNGGNQKRTLSILKLRGRHAHIFK